MKKCNRKLYYKKIGELTQSEFEQLFNVSTDINEPSFREILKPIADQSISSINIGDYNLNDMKFMTAYLLGKINGMKEEMPKNHLIVLFGEPGCGKSYLIQLISEIQKRDLKEITEDDRKLFGVQPTDYTSDREITALKEMVDSISIIPKKTSRPPRDGNPNKPEIQEGVSREEVEKCEWTYEFAGNIYGISKQEIDEALKTGDAILIGNDPSIETMKRLKKDYPENFFPILVYIDVDEQKWVQTMKQANRTNEEIGRRRKTYGMSQKIYEAIWEDIATPEVILNIGAR